MASRLGMNGADRRMETRDPNESGSSPEKRPSHTSASVNYNDIGPKPYSYSELARVTGHFSLNNLIGRGGFGHVFKAVLDGEIRAIKKLDFLDVQSEGSLEREIMVIKSISHRNLVELVGYCIDGANRLLILKYFPNGSLRFKLHGSDNVLDWETRMKIAIGSARGLEYLHENCKPKIIHLDIKPDNILLDENFEPKITDFGLAQFFTDGATHISKSSVMGTHVREEEDSNTKTDQMEYCSQLVTGDLISDLPSKLGKSPQISEQTDLTEGDLPRNLPKSLGKLDSKQTGNQQTADTPDLKPLPSHLKYAYLGAGNTLPVNISNQLSQKEEEKLLDVLRKHKKEIGWTLEDIKGTSRPFGGGSRQDAAYGKHVAAAGSTFFCPSTVTDSDLPSDLPSAYPSHWSNHPQARKYLSLFSFIFLYVYSHIEDNMWDRCGGTGEYLFTDHTIF